MDLTDSLKQFAADTLATNTTHGLALQILVLAVAVALAFFVRHNWNRLVGRKVIEATGKRIQPLALRASKRLTFSLTLALVILVANAIFELAGLSNGLLRLAIPLILVLALVRVLIFLLRVAAGPKARTSRSFELWLSVTLWILAVMHILGWLPHVANLFDGIGMTFGETRISLLSVARFVVLVALLSLIAFAVSRILENRLSHDEKLESGVRTGLIKVIRYSILVVAVLVAFHAAGFKLTTLTVIGGALGVGIGFGLQKVASNLVSGFLVLFDRSIRPGDVITIGDSYGWVAKMGARYIVVRDRSGVDTLIPNEQLVTSQVINWSYGDKHIRIQLPVQISYDDDPELAMHLVMKASRSNDRVLDDPGPAVRLMGFGDSGINLELRVWIDDPDQGVNNVRSDIYLGIWRSFKEAGITIPYPQRDVHFKRQFDGADSAAPAGEDWSQ